MQPKIHMCSKIEQLLQYIHPTFEAAFKEQDFKNAIPDAQNLEEAIGIYEQFYAKPMQLEHGVVFIELQ